MQRTRSSRNRSNMFAKDPNVLPFFTLHPKTKVGTIIRVLMIVFVLVTLAFTLLMSQGIFFMWFAKLYYLVYLVPIVGLVALALLALFKRMKTTITKIAIPGLLAFLFFSVLMSVASIISYTYDLQLSPKMGLSSNGRSIILMRECADPDDAVRRLSEDGATTITEYRYRVDAHLFTLRVPQAVEGETYELTGEILVPSDSAYQYEIKGEWLDDTSLRVYISKDTSGIGHGEITLRFTPGETAPASPEADANAVYKTAFTSPDGSRGAYLYRADDYIFQTTDSPLMIGEEDLKQIFHAYPRTMVIFARISTRVEGRIVLEPYGTLTGVRVEWLKDDVARITPTEDSAGASGEITIYFSEKAGEAETATPSEATPGETE